MEFNYLKRIKDTIEDSDMTQLDIANELKINQPRLSKYLNGDLKLPIPYFIEICNILETTPNYLLGFEDKEVNKWTIFLKFL